MPIKSIPATKRIYNHLRLKMDKKCVNMLKLIGRDLSSKYVFSTEEKVSIRKNVGWLGLCILTELTNLVGKTRETTQFNISNRYMAKKHGFAERSWRNKKSELIKKGYLCIIEKVSDSGGEEINIYIAVPCVNKLTASEMKNGYPQLKPHDIQAAAI